MAWTAAYVRVLVAASLSRYLDLTIGARRFDMALFYSSGNGISLMFFSSFYRKRIPAAHRTVSRQERSADVILYRIEGRCFSLRPSSRYGGSRLSGKPAL